ncbi:low affinity immunoglobulin epsilon Fc receptor-like [Podarcis raffonei]|uniref:low affinity immunoglobulin epsilon Fc receptor-like n=1 Tax=Podarcis raffonei TaxID=65483 RepID=UPI0023293CD1|nr:low affinity immunoglobulin epsilon Fc receptor-like [Podarcis raffonei]
MAQGGIYRRCEEPENLEINEKMESFSSRKAGGFLLQHCRCGSNETSISVLFIVTAASFLLWTIISAVLISKSLEMSTQLEQLHANQSMLLTNGSKMEKRLEEIHSSHSSSESELSKALKALETKYEESQKNGNEKLRELSRDSSRSLAEIDKIEDALLKINASTCQVCPKGWLFNKGSCYSFQVKPGPWSHARKACEDERALLVIINDEEEQSFLVLHLKQKYYWIGLQDIETENKFTWVDRSTATYTKWGAGEPNNYGHGEDCVEMTPRGWWNDVPCGNNIDGWICEKPWSC